MPGVAENEPEIKRKKQKKLKGEAEMAAGASTAESEKKKKKRKSDNGTAEENPTKKQKKVSSDEDVPASPSENPYALDNFRISEAVKEKLRSREINALFAIQAQTFDIVFDGDDLVARARTGQGKTLAFVLPIVESLSRAGTPQKKFGRAPSVLILLPTRELAQQVHADIECYGGVVGLKSICVYGKSSYGPQESAMRRGVDIVVGTPGRVKDLLERGDLNLKTLKFRVLDEADEMLKMGFVEPVEYILSAVEDASTVQTLLFSATMPDWVKQIAQKFFKPDKKIVDLVGDEKMKASTSVTHLLMPCSYHARSQIVPDVIKVYGSGGRVIVFTETKNDASELAAALSHIAKALHGDIPQHLREATLAGFRSGKFNVLVATDVAARGLDINDVQLIIQCEPPRDAETYIHRSGRTGRAGNSGVAILLYDRKKEYMVPIIERKAGFKFERISAPQPSAIAKESASSATKGVLEVSDSVLPLFREAAQELVEKSGAPALDLLAKALAKLAGYTEAKRRSLQTSHDDSTTLLFESPKQIFSAGYIFNALRGCISEELVSEIRRMNLTVDGMGAVFDVPSIRVDEFLKGLEDQNFGVSVAETLPELTPKPEKDNNWGRGGFNGGRGGRSAGNGGGRGRGGYGYGNNNGRRWGK